VDRDDGKEEDVTKKKIEKLVKEKENLLAETIKNLGKSPEGALKCQNKEGVTYYYLQKKNHITDKWEKTYLKKSQSSLIKQLAQKSYLRKVKRALEEQIHALNHFTSTYNETALEQIYENLPEERKQLVTPIALGVQQTLKAWDEETYEPYNAYSEYKIYETQRGETVRSKSEVIIANLLYQYSEDLDYKYERPLILHENNGKEVIIHPDFTIINKHTGKIHYYEHAGKMDDPRYAIDFVKKIEMYSANGILQGRELWVTYETAGMPLRMGNVRRIAESILEE